MANPSMQSTVPGVHILDTTLYAKFQALYSTAEPDEAWNPNAFEGGKVYYLTDNDDNDKVVAQCVLYPLSAYTKDHKTEWEEMQTGIEPGAKKTFLLASLARLKDDNDTKKGKGKGKELIEKIQKQDGIETLIVEVDLHNRPGLRDFYSKLGFKESGLKPNGNLHIMVWTKNES